MAANVSSYLFTGSRGKILLATSAFFLLTIIVSFRGRITDSDAWSSTVGGYLGGDNGKPTTPIPPIPEEDSGHHVPADSSPDMVLTVTTTAISVTTTTATTTVTESNAKSTGALHLTPGSDICDGFPDTSNVLVIMRTGATEAYNKLPIHFMTTLKCVKDFVLFSDMKMNMAGYEIQDVLDGLDEDFVAGNNDFDIYRDLLEFYRQHQDPRDLAGTNGWTLDKYKFVPMMYRGWDYRTDADWYVFIEADTFIHWENTMTYLNTLDPADDYYIGSPTYLDIEFAHGGTGYIISQSAMRKAVGKHPEMMDQYSQEVTTFCCGDRMIAKILLEEDVRLTKAWPMLNGEKPLTLPFGERQWCQPVLTMHHVTAQEVSKMWNFEMRRRKEGITTPMLWKDVFNEFVKSNLKPLREDWDNLSGDLAFSTDKDRDFGGRTWAELTDAEKSSPESPEKCRALCDEDQACYQWKHHGNECQISYTIKLGVSKQPENGQAFTSGWNFDRINNFRQDMQECNGNVDWSTSGP